MSFLKKLKTLLTATRPPAPDDLVRVGMFPNEAEAYIAKGLLESNDIPAMVESNAQIYTPQIKTGVGVLVFYRDYSAAREILNRQ